MKWEDVRILPDFLNYQAHHRALPNCLNHKKNGKWVALSTQELIQGVNRVSLGLLAEGLKTGDRVAILSTNRPEWNMVDLGTLQIGCVVTPLYPTASGKDITYILQHSESRVVFVETAEMAAKLKTVQAECPHLHRIVTFEPVAGFPGFADWLGGTQPNEAELRAARNRVQPQDLATLVYTSGTTGTPKGVMLSHGNMVSNLKSILSQTIFPDTTGINDLCVLSFLPLCHVYERMAFFVYLYQSAAVYYAESLEKLSENLQEVRPYSMTCVPRLLEKVYAKIMAKRSELPAHRRAIFDWSMRLAERYELNGAKGWWYEFQLGIARRLVFPKWHAALGGRLRVLISGGAALQPRLARLFSAAGFQVLEGYGMSEASPIISANTLEPNGMRFGSVGKPIPGVEVKIVPEEGYPAGSGEICARGPNVMSGYFKNPEVTAETIDPDGFLHTGDIGYLDPDGFLVITDRKKEIFKTAGGSYIAPQELENKLKEIPLVEQVMVVGEHKPFPAAILTLDPVQVADWARRNGLPNLPHAELISQPKLVEFIQAEVARINELFTSYKQVKKTRIVPDTWTPENNELTPTLKLKRRVLQEKYKYQIAGFYS